MSKTLTIPRLTQGAEPLEVTVRKLTPSMIDEGYNLCLMYDIGLHERAAEAAEEEAKVSLELLNSMASMPALASSMEHAIKQHIAKHLAVKAEQRAVEANKKEVIKNCGAIDPTRTIISAPLSVDYLWTEAKKILGNPVYLEISTGRRLEEWRDVDDDDFVRVCEEVCRQTPRFFIGYLKKPLPKPEVPREAAPLT